ncbi:V-type ATP synthase subunit A [Streptomyces sp. RPA4-5]|uniref:V-type ATP synthase subunit A n=1 Tax=unclassified Streptomyces TaxID=2593676 RepID=UPI00143EC4CE|nr:MULTISPECIES: V-type ATP synthase subunit A [unclassified Streptomyces]QIY53551.1 V-type ATP synthase subunit A [Streptomyces sp. RPA4-5]WJY36076.1 V-type ATP synthase subunit A [Streptomyces sp. P9-2B-2]
MEDLTAAGRSATRPRPSRILRVAGPLVELEYAGDVAMNDMVLLGASQLPAEVVAITTSRVTVQAYEYTGGLAPGHHAHALGAPVSAQLSPALLGGVFDGLLRPLAAAGDWLRPGTHGDPEPSRTWLFTPSVPDDRHVTEGSVIGEVATTGSLRPRILVPPGCSGEVEFIAAGGEHPEDAVLAVVGGVEIRARTSWPVRRARPVRERVPAQVPLATGQRVIDLLFPVACGSTVAVPGGFGTGKTVLLQQIAKWCDADVIVYIGCGERGNEMADVITDFAALSDPRTGGRLADRTVIIANTSNMPMMAREASVYTGVTVAEYFRDMGYDVVVIADSTSRWAEALREFASRTGALPAEEGYPAGLASALAAFYERAAAVTTLGAGPGSVTVIGAVSPPGGDMAEPVTSHTERFVRGLWTLDRDLAYARHYPAVSWSHSFSRDADVLTGGPAAGAEREAAGRRAAVAGLLAEADRLADLVDLVGITALPAHERISVLAGRLVREAVLQQSALSPTDAHSTPAKTAALVDAVLAVVERCRTLVVSGLPPESIEQADFTALLRAREEAGPDDTAVVEASRDAVLGVLDELP